MKTNLLDTTVKGIVNNNEIVGKIRAIYRDSGDIFAVVVTDTGQILVNVALQLLSIPNERLYGVILYWEPHQKIKAIKVVRDVLNVGLKEAKEFVESRPSRIILSTNLTLDEAQQIKAKISFDVQMECEVKRNI